MEDQKLGAPGLSKCGGSRQLDWRPLAVQLQPSASTGFPAISMQRVYAVGLPVGVELLGLECDERSGFICLAYEQAKHLRRAPARTPALGVRRKATVPAGIEWAGSGRRRRGVRPTSRWIRRTNEKLTYNISAPGFRRAIFWRQTLHRVGGRYRPRLGSACRTNAFRAFRERALSDPDREG